MSAKKIILISVIAVMSYIDCVMGEVYSAELIHRFSDQLKEFRPVKNDEVWFVKGSLEYYKMLLRRDAWRLKGMKLSSSSNSNSNLKTSVVFPLEGSQTENFGNNFGW